MSFSTFFTPSLFLSLLHIKPNDENSLLIAVEIAEQPYNFGKEIHFLFLKIGNTWSKYIHNSPSLIS